MFNYSTRSGHSAASWSLLGQFVCLTSEAKMPLSGLTLRGAERLTSEVFCCCMSESRHLEPDASVVQMPGPWGAGGCPKGKAQRNKDGKPTQGNSPKQSISDHLPRVLSPVGEHPCWTHPPPELWAPHQSLIICGEDPHPPQGFPCAPEM